MGFIKGFHHVAVFTKDSDKSLAFYKGLGGEITFSFPINIPGKSNFLIHLGGNATLEIVSRGYDEAETNARWAHIALATDDVDGAFDLALKAGATVKIAPQDIMLGTKSVRNAFVFGPDGESIEFFKEK